MRVFKTNAMQGYKQYAWAIRVAKSVNGYDYLCIACNNSHVFPGELFEDLADFYIEEELSKEEAQRMFDRSELQGTFLFKHFLSTYSDPT